MAQKTKSPKSVNSIIEQCASVLPALHSGIKSWGKSAIFIKMLKVKPMVFEIFLKGAAPKYVCVAKKKFQ